MNLFDALRAKKGDPSANALVNMLVNEVRARALAELEHTKDLFLTSRPTRSSRNAIVVDQFSCERPSCRTV